MPWEDFLKAFAFKFLTLILQISFIPLVVLEVLNVNIMQNLHQDFYSFFSITVPFFLLKTSLSFIKRVVKSLQVRSVDTFSYVPQERDFSFLLQALIYFEILTPCLYIWVEISLKNVQQDFFILLIFIFELLFFVLYVLSSAQFLFKAQALCWWLVIRTRSFKSDETF